MRLLVPVSFILFLWLAAPAAAAIAPRHFTPAEATAYREALAVTRRMPSGSARREAAFYLAYRLIHRGLCQEALPILNGELARLDGPAGLAAIGRGSALAGDPRCIAWSAARLKAAAAEPGKMKPGNRAAIRFHAATLSNLLGMAGGGEVTAVDEQALSFMPDELRGTTVVVDGLGIQIGFANPPRAHQVLLLERLALFRGTPLAIRLARGLAARAGAEPAYFTDVGWIRVALALLEDGDPDGARRLLADGKVSLISFEGLEAEAAFRRGEYEEAARRFAGSDWPTRMNSVTKLGRLAPAALLPWLDEEGYWGGNNAFRELAMLVESLDRRGDGAGAERAAAAALRHFVNQGAYNREALILSRLGDMEGARSAILAAEKEGRVNLPLVRVGMAAGAAMRGDADRALAVIGEVPARYRGYALVKLLTDTPGASPAVKQRIEKSLERLLGKRERIAVAADTIVSLARTGASAVLLARLSRQPIKPESRSRLAISVAWAAAEAGHSRLAHVLADRAIGAAPRERRGRDTHYVALAHIYAHLGDIDAAIRMAHRAPDPARKVDALTRFMEPPPPNLVPKLSFETF